MADEVLKNWVALLEFKVDAGQARDLILKVSSVSTAILGVAAAVEAASLAFKGLLLKSSESVEAGSFIAERAGGTIKDLTALRNAVAATGGTFGEADTAIEGFAKAWRNQSIQNTVRETLRLAGMTKKEIADLEATGNLFLILRKYIQAVNAKHNPAAEDAYRKAVGIPEYTGRFHNEKFEEVIRRTYEQWDKANINVDKLEKGSQRLQESWRNLWGSVDTIVKSVTEKLAPYLGDQIDKFVEILDEHGEEIQEWITEAVKQITEFAKYLATQVKPATDAFRDVLTPVVASLRWMLRTFMELTGETNAWKAALELVLGYIAGTWLTRILAVLTGLSAHPVILAVMAATAMGAGYAGWMGNLGLPEQLHGPEGTMNEPGGGGPGGTFEGFGDEGVGGWAKRKWRERPKWMGGTGGGSADAGATPPAATAPLSGGSAGDPKLVGLNKELVSDFLAAEKATGIHFSVTEGLRTREEAEANARRRVGVKNSQHLYGAAADLKLYDEHGNITTNRAVYKRFADAYEAASKARGGRGRWLGNLQRSRWKTDIWHFDQGIGYGQSHQRNPYTGPDVPAAERDPNKVPDTIKKSTPFGDLSTDEIHKRLDHKGPAKPFNQSSSSYSFGQNVAVNIHGGDNDPATKVGGLAGPVHDSRLLRNTKGAIA